MKAHAISISVLPQAVRRRFRAIRFTVPALALAAALCGCSKPAAKEAPAAGAEKPKESESTVKRGTNGNVVVTLPVESQQLARINSEPAVAASYEPDIKCYGRVLDASTLGPLAADLSSTQATAEASASELKRLETLAGQNNTSARTLEAGRAAAARDRALVEAARLRLVSAWGAALAGEHGLTNLVVSLANQDALLVQLTAEPGSVLSASAKSARITSATGSGADGDKPATMEARLLGPAPSADPQTQGRAVLLLAEHNPLHLSPGSSIIGFLPGEGGSRTGVNIPDKAVVHHNGAIWAYVQTGEKVFERRLVSDEPATGTGRFVTSGFAPGDKVVVSGAQVLLSEELKGEQSAGD